MYRSFCAILMLAIPFALSADDKKDKPVTFQSKEGKFSVTLPKKPTESTNKVPSDIGELEMHMFLVDQSSKAYLVTYHDYPPRSVVNKEDKILDAVAEGS